MDGSILDELALCSQELQRYLSPHALQQVFAHFLTQKLNTSTVIPHHYESTFQCIRLLDSTIFQLPDTFAYAYQGAGGSSHTAGVKI
jgi:hypothetical protein